MNPDEYTVLGVTLDLHMAVTGAGTSMSYDEVRKKWQWLVDRLRLWTPSLGDSHAFDSAVRTLAYVAANDAWDWMERQR